MKAKLYDEKGNQKAEIDLPEFFSSTIRKDLVQKYFEVEKYILRQVYGAYDEAGKRHSASGTISHLRHTWKGAYGKGISRVPRKTMWRRGTQFFWVGAEISGSRGGRKSHPPKGIYGARKINKKEAKAAFASAFASTANKELVSQRYSSIEIKSTPFVIESVPTKAKEMISTFQKILGSAYTIAEKKKKVRPGKGKNRGRKFKSTAGLLLVKSQSENISSKNFDVKNIQDVNIADLYPLGRLTIYTKKALEDLKNVA